MIVLGWMLFVGFACYMGTFPEFTVGHPYPVRASDQAGKIVEVSAAIRSQGVMGTE